MFHTHQTNHNRKEKTVKTTANKITREARLVVAFISLASIGLLWAIYKNAQLGDAYGALVLASTVGALGALVAYIITTELRDIQSRKTRKMLNKYHTQQVNELSDAIAKLETENARLARSSFNTIETLCSEIDALKLSLETASLNENGLLNLVRLACLYTVENAQQGAIDERVTRYESERYEQMASDLNAFAIVDSGELTNDRLTWYAQAFHNGEGVGLGDSVKRDELLERAQYAIDGGDLVEQVATYTYSATDALILGTLDKAYTITNEYGRETVYPLA